MSRGLIQTQNRCRNSIVNRLSSYIHQYEKHKAKYDKNLNSKAEMNYSIGFVLGKSNRNTAASAQFKNSWMSNPWRLKALLKLIYLKLFR